MPALVGLLGLFGFVAFLIVFIVSIIRKKSKRLGAIGMLACLILFAIGLAITPPSDKSSEGEPTVTHVVKESDTIISEENSPTITSKLVESDSSVEDVAPSTSEKEPAIQDVIPGLLAADIKLNLKDWGLKKVDTKNSESSGDISYSSSTKDSDTGTELSYYFVTDSVAHVKYATFSALNLTGVSEEKFIDVASGFLKYSATVPFDDAEPAKSKEWVAETIKKCNKEGHVESMTVGNVEFSLYGVGSSSRFLEIKLVKN